MSRTRGAASVLRKALSATAPALPSTNLAATHALGLPPSLSNLSLSKQLRNFRASSSAAKAGAKCPLPDKLCLPNGRVQKKPEEPHPDDCCGRGCIECIWTIYTEQLQDYQAAVAEARGEEVPEDPFQALERRLNQKQ